MQEIYKKIESVEDKSCEIGISYLEVYNETVIDLLSPGGIFFYNCCNIHNLYKF